MAFQSAKEYNEKRYGGMFRLQNDGEYADVIIMYQSDADVLVADTHYIKSEDYSGYVHCLGSGCPACAKNIRVQTKLFIPMYDIGKDEIVYFDRSMRFEPQLQHDVFSKYPNPSNFVFRITRHGVQGDINTRYEIQAVGTNNLLTFDQICEKFKTTFPENYETICKGVDTSTLSIWLNRQNLETDVTPNLSNYSVSPRAVTPTSQAVVPENVSIPDAVCVPEVDLSSDIVDEALSLDDVPTDF